MGMVFLYEDERETIPVIQTTTGLEYEITTKIKKLVDIDKATIAFAKVSNQESLKNENLSQILRERYAVQNANLNQEILSNTSLLLMNGVEDSLSNNEYQNLSNYISKGGNLLITQNRIKTDLSTQQANIIESNIFTLLDSYGLYIQPNLVLDRNCGKVNVQQNLGFLRIPVPMDYPFLPVIQKKYLNKDIVMVSGLESLRLMFPSEIILDDSISNAIPLFTSSNQSTSMEEFFNLNPSPDSNPSFQQLNEDGKILGAIADSANYNIGSGKVILISDSKFMADDGGGAAGENHIFIMNAIDYLLGDQELIALRSREITNRPLIELEDNAKTKWKWINILLPTILVIAFGVYRMRRETNRSKMLEEIYD